MCDDDCEHFSTCISACPKKTCDNRLVYDQLLAECSQVQNLCFEGCDLLPCPPGQVYASLNKPATCIPEPLCETPSCTINGKVYREGERVYDDAVCNHACEIWSVGQFVVEGGWGWGRGGLGAWEGVHAAMGRVCTAMPMKCDHLVNLSLRGGGERRGRGGGCTASMGM